MGVERGVWTERMTNGSHCHRGNRGKNWGSKYVLEGIRTGFSPLELCGPFHCAAATVVDRMGHGFF